MSLDTYRDVINCMVIDRRTYRDIADYLLSQGVVRGASEANVRKFCHENAINRRGSYVPDAELCAAVDTAVQEVRCHLLSIPNSIIVLNCIQ